MLPAHASAHGFGACFRRMLAVHAYFAWFGLILAQLQRQSRRTFLRILPAHGLKACFLCSFQRMTPAHVAHAISGAWFWRMLLRMVLTRVPAHASIAWLWRGHPAHASTPGLVIRRVLPYTLPAHGSGACFWRMLPAHGFGARLQRMHPLRCFLRIVSAQAFGACFQRMASRVLPVRRCKGRWCDLRFGFRCSCASGVVVAPP